MSGLPRIGPYVAKAFSLSLRVVGWEKEYCHAPAAEEKKD
jgi:hypothetical protein